MFYTYTATVGDTSPMSPSPILTVTEYDPRVVPGSRGIGAENQPIIAWLRPKRWIGMAVRASIRDHAAPEHCFSSGVDIKLGFDRQPTVVFDIVQSQSGRHCFQTTLCADVSR